MDTVYGYEYGIAKTARGPTRSHRIQKTVSLRYFTRLRHGLMSATNGCGVVRL